PAEPESGETQAEESSEDAAVLEASDEEDDDSDEDEADEEQDRTSDVPESSVFVPESVAVDVIPASAAEVAGAAPREPERRPREEARAASGGGRAAAAVEPSGRPEPRFRSKRMLRRSGRQRNGRGAPQRPKNGQRDASRLSRSTPIREVVREGQEVI